MESIGCRPSMPPRFYRVGLRNKWYVCRKFQTLRYHCTHIVADCAHASINAKLYIDEVYTLECTLCIWGNEFNLLCDFSTWEVPPPTFKLVLDKGLHRIPKGCPQVTRIHSEIDMKEKTSTKLYGMCRTVGHNQT
ncbi:hypothetical protein PVK06_027863 [Gossypium arboreum]|uniref:Uncharacterized protein n=1 Tax=Gossypium arboreum TaxID=29729 RepID=A0ABR0P1P5_GOSAR|nr:hypothetical protein PVK06_027863 [Gossypium arboreum]